MSSSRPRNPLLLSALMLSVIAVSVQLNPVGLADPPPPGLHSSRINVGFIDGVPSNIASRVDSEGGVLIQTVLDLKMVTVRTKDGVSQATLIQRLGAYADTQYAVQDVLGEMALLPNDTHYASAQRTKLSHTGIETAWDFTLGSTSVVVGIIDTGIHCLHDDFRPGTIGTTICDPRSTETLDPHGHGTHAAGVVFAITNNARGIAGVSKSTLFPLPVGTEFLLSDIVLRLMQAISYEVDVLSLSGSAIIDCESDDPTYGWLYRKACTPLLWAVENVTSHGIVFAAAAGNENVNCPEPWPGPPGWVAYPAAYPDVIGVGASSGLARWTGQSLNDGSNCGPEVDLLAPGKDIMSTVPGLAVMCSGAEYCQGSGTSAATPFVAGLAALVWSKCPSLTRQQVVDLIQSNAQHLDGLTDDEQGMGLVQADATMEATAC